MAAKILLRLQNIGQLETILQELLECTSSFRPWGLFAASPLSDNKENVGGFRRPTSPKKAKGGGGNTARRSALNRRKVLAPRRPTSDDEEPAPGRNTSASNGAAPRFGCVADLRPYMRELELDILKILGYGEIQRQLVDTNLEPKDNSDTVKLMYPELKYLLEDLNRKLEHKLVPVATIPFFAKKKEFSDDKMNHTEFTLLSRMSASEFVEKSTLSSVRWLTGRSLL
ncbi:hypothetical protein BC938DRAFT_483732 [Jimgerdemannia flammicorona]|uniref:Uncharacterized protein n=1 Tax=Jimgerdemannia flammicorona TaxID=994334 RepID=A0A433QBA9_9FUNG|nr:hypothetical protein BC938DRAFT_483732 [Jimgerdemannia flammicorona]